MAPEQVVGDRVTELTDLFALGLVISELFVGRPFFAANTILERLNLREKTAAPELGPEFDPRLAAIINACLEEDPAARPPTVLSVAAILPGGDPLAAAVAEGRVPSPAMVASAAKHGALDLPIAWALVVAQIVGVVAVASQAHVLTIPASAVPTAQVLVERSREILSRIAPGVAAVDSDAWFSAASSDTEPISVRLVYRQSPRPLVPANLFRIVTETDPPRTSRVWPVSRSMRRRDSSDSHGSPTRKRVARAG